MELRLSEIKDIENIIKIINKGKEKLKNENIDQWQGEYPNKDVIMEDIEKGYSYVLELDGEIIGTAAVSLDGEETYNKIYEGKWISEEPYGVVHRFCVNLDLKLERKGSKLFNKIEELLVTKGIKSIKIDTHEENKSMRKTLLNNGFIYCGIIYVNNGEKRVAYEKIIS